ncbi:MAG: GlyGly-CTERM sorting domain-containing protein [Pseudomonadota bacterium]
MQKAVATAISKDQPLQFAVSAPLSLTLDDGNWSKLDDGNWSWRTRVYSAGAQSLNLHFSQFHLPADAALWLYDPNGEVIAGPYTSANELADQQLWTAVVNGETAIVEVRVPSASKDQVRLQLAEVNHGYRGFAKAGTGSFGDSGSCEIDVVCPAGQPYLAQARALARITISGTALCSGQLVNNVRQDNTPFFLTANHCGISSSNASSVVFYWNYQNSRCGGNGTEPSYQTQSGSIWVAGNVSSDFTLLKTAQHPSSSFSLYLAGWNAGNSAPTSGGIVHHPAGDVTKIAIYSSPAVSLNNQTLCTGSLPVTGTCSSTRSVNVWRVSYSQGVTEGGSSGSALYDQNKLIVGQLSGGSTACGASSSATDIYGRTNAAWTATSAASGQLKANLDPDNTGTLSLAGKNLGAVSSGGSSGSGSSGGGSSGSGSKASGGGAMPVFTLLGLAVFGLLRRRATSRRASSV